MKKARPSVSPEIAELLSLVANGRLFAVQDWIKTGRPVRATDNELRECCPLWKAAQSGFHSMVEVLLRATQWSQTALEAALCTAMSNGRIDVVDLLLENGAPIDAIDFEEVCRTVKPELMIRFLRAGVDPAKDNAFARALQDIKARPLLRFYKEMRGEFPKLDDQAALALKEAVKERKLRWVALLRWAGADPFRRVPDDLYSQLDLHEEESGTTAAREACYGGNPEIFKVLKLKPTAEQARAASAKGEPCPYRRREAPPARRRASGLDGGVRRPEASAMRRVAEVAGVFLKLGLTSFGGPAAHVGYFHRTCIQERHWMEEGEFADAIALCQFLPGPGSSQLAYALGRRRAGFPGGAAATLAFLLPSAVLMFAFGYVLRRLPSSGPPAWVQGLKAAAVGIVAHAVVAMGRRLSRGPARIAIGAGTAIAILLVPKAGAAPVLIALAAAVGAAFLFTDPAPARVGDGPKFPGRRAALPLLAWAVLAVLLAPFVNRTGPASVLSLTARFFRAGSVVFGGGHVVLPLLRGELVPGGWMTDPLFLAAYGAAQALPGPLFSFAGCLGVLVAPTSRHAWTYGLAALTGIFLPGWLLVAGCLPWWDALRNSPRLRGAVAGANAAVVGLLAASFWKPVIVAGITRPADAAIAAMTFAALHFPAIPVWAVVAASGFAGFVLRPR